MRRPPRNPRAPLLDLTTILNGMLQGAAALATVLVAYRWALGQVSSDQARSFAFSVLVMVDVGLIFANRSRTRTILEMLHMPNRTVWTVTLAELAVHALALYLHVLAGVFHFGPLALINVDRPTRQAPSSMNCLTKSSADTMPMIALFSVTTT
jgi:Ca2+-transporting ATPase